MSRVARCLARSWTHVAAALALVACGSSQPAAEPSPRSPSYDYREAPRGGDDKVLGAHEQAPGDWVEGTVTNRHLGPGWELEDGKVVPRPEQRNAGADPSPTPVGEFTPTPADAGASEIAEEPSPAPATN